MTRTVPGHGLLVVALLLGPCMSGCTASSSGPLQVHGWEIRVHDPWNVTFSFTVRNEGKLDVRIVESHLTPEQFDSAPDGGVRYGGGGFVPVEQYPARARGEPAIFNDSEVLKPGESRRFSLLAYYPPKDNDVGLDDTYNAQVSLEYEVGARRWSTAHGSPCLKSDGTEGEAVAWACNRRFEHASPID